MLRATAWANRSWTCSHELRELLASAVIAADAIRPHRRLMNRRTFVQTATVAVSAVVGASCTKSLAAEKPHWPIGCFSRAWGNWSYDEALDGIAAAGYKLTGLL